MHQELSEGTRIGLGIAILAMLLSMVLLMMQISVNLSRAYTNDIASVAGLSYGDDLISLDVYNKEVPVALIYTSLVKTGDQVREFELNVGGTTYASKESLKDYMDKKMFIDVQESNGYYKVRVRDR